MRLQVRNLISCRHLSTHGKYLDKFLAKGEVAYTERLNLTIHVGRGIFLITLDIQLSLDTFTNKDELSINLVITLTRRCDDDFSERNSNLISHVH